MTTYEDLVDAMSGVNDAADVAAKSFGRMRRTAREMQEHLQAIAAHEKEIRAWDQRSLWKEWR